MLCYMALTTDLPACYAAGAPEALRAQQRSLVVLTTDIASRFEQRATLAHCEEGLAEWADRRGYEKLAFAEGLLVSMGSKAKCPAMNDYTWVPGTDDLSLPAGRAKWAIERLLGVKVSGIVDRSVSHDDIRRLQEEASHLVDAYRQGIMARAADHEVSPDQFTRLKRKYKNKIVLGFTESSIVDRVGEMHDLLGDWPPVGRRYEDLVSIIGAKGENRDCGVVYAFESEGNEYEFCLTVRDGIIRSVAIRSPHW